MKDDKNYKTFILTDEGEKELVGLSTPPEIEEDERKEDLYEKNNNHIN